MRKHFAAIADATDHQILIYDIPYWTSVNLTNDSLLALAEMLNIVGVTDSSGINLQSLEQPARLHLLYLWRLDTLYIAVQRQKW